MDYLYETHMHTAEASACAVSGAAEQAAAYKRRGYAGIIVTDHFLNGPTTCPANWPWAQKMKRVVSGYAAAKQVGDRIGLDVFLGWEFTVKGSDFLTYGLGLDFLLAHPGLDKLSAAGYSALVRKCGGYLAQAHPYRDAWYLQNKYPVRPNLVDGIEVRNAAEPDRNNAKALAFARQHNLPCQAGSDSHDANTLFFSGIKLKERAESVMDIVDAIRAGEAEVF